MDEWMDRSVVKVEVVKVGVVKVEVVKVEWRAGAARWCGALHWCGCGGGTVAEWIFSLSNIPLLNLPRDS